MGIAEIKNWEEFVCYVGTKSLGNAYFTVEESGLGKSYDWGLSSIIYPIVINETTIQINGYNLNLWNPIGTKENPFSGHFIGNDCTSSNCAGLFGYIKGRGKTQQSIIRNVIINNGFIGCNDRSGKTGSIGGSADSTTIISSQNNVIISSRVKRKRLQASTGGIVGQLLSCGKIIHCINSGCTSDKNHNRPYCGGIVGYMSLSSRVVNSYNKGSEKNKEITLDLHSYTLETLDYLFKEKDSLKSSVKIIIIMGKGSHSVDNNPLLKNKLIEYCKTNKVPFHIDLKNKGRLIIVSSFKGVQKCSFIKRYNLLYKVSYGEYDLVAKSAQGRETLIVWGRIPRILNQEKALIDVIRFQ